MKTYEDFVEHFAGYEDLTLVQMSINAESPRFIAKHRLVLAGEFYINKEKSGRFNVASDHWFFESFVDEEIASNYLLALVKFVEAEKKKLAEREEQEKERRGG